MKKLTNIQKLRKLTKHGSYLYPIVRSIRTTLESGPNQLVYRLAQRAGKGNLQTGNEVWFNAKGEVVSYINDGKAAETTDVNNPNVKWGIEYLNNVKF